MSDQQPPRRLGASLLAILAGFLVVVILSIGTDVLLHLMGVFPKLGQPMADRLLVLATVYRGVTSRQGSPPRVP